MAASTKKESKDSGYALLNKETGEIQTIPEGSVIIPPEKNAIYQKRKKKKEDGIKDLKTRGTFVQVLHNQEREIEKELSSKQCAVLLNLFFYVSIESKNYIIHIDGEKKGQKMNQKEIALHLGKSERQTMRDLGDLVELKALICEKNPKDKKEYFYTLNNEFFTSTEQKGTKIAFTKVFQKKLYEMRSKLCPSEYGALLKFIRFFHYQTFYLVSNPDYDIIIDPALTVAQNLLLDENESVLQHLNQIQLAEIIGINKNLVKSYVKAYEKAGAMMVIKQHKSYRFIIHPNLMFRKLGKGNKGDNEYAEFLRSQFKQFPNTSKRKRK